MKKHIFKIKGAAFMAPSALGILTFFVIPFMVIIYYSMVDNPVRRNFVDLITSFLLLQIQLLRRLPLIRLFFL